MADLVQLEDLPADARTALPHDHPILNDYASRMEAQAGLPNGLMNAIKNVGERSNSNQVSPAGAQGVMQLMPGTQKQLGVTDPTDPLQSIRAGAQYLASAASKLGTNDPTALAAAYHAGPSSKAARGDFTGSPITKKYADAVAAAMPMGSANAEDSSPAATAAAGGVDPADLPDATPAGGQPAAPAYDPTTGMSGTEKFLAGAGKFFSDTGSGVRQLAADALNPVSQALTGKDVLSQDYEGEKERARLDSPLMHTGAGLAGNIFANATTLALPGGAIGKAVSDAVPLAAAGRAVAMSPTIARLLAQYGPAAVSSGALSTLTPTVAPGERTRNAVVGAVASPVLSAAGQGLGALGRGALGWAEQNIPGAAGLSAASGRGVDAVMDAATNLGPLLRKSFNATATPTDRQSVARAVMNGIPVYPQQLDHAGTDALSRGQIAGQNSAFTRAVNSTMGQTTDDIPGAISSAHDDLGQVYNNILDHAQIPLTPNLGTQAAQIHNDYLYNNVTGAPDSGLEDAVNRLTNLTTQGRTLTGRQYQDMLRDYSAGANRAQVTSLNKGQVTSTPDFNAAQAYRDLADAVQSHADQYLQPGDSEAFRQANAQWRNMRTLQQVAPVANGVTDYSPTTLARKLKVTDPNGFFFNQGDPTLTDLSKFGTKFMGMEANGPTTLLQRAKAAAMNSAPILAGDAAGAILAGDAMSGNSEHNDQPSMAARVLKGAAAAVLTHGALTGASRALNPAIDLNYLNQPRGALAEVIRRASLAPAIAAGINQDRNSGETPYRVDIHGIGPGDQ